MKTTSRFVALLQLLLLPCLLYAQENPAQYVAGMQAYSRKEYYTASQQLTAFLQTADPAENRFPSAKYFLAASAMQMGEYNAAAFELEDLLHKYPYSVHRENAFFDLGRVYFKLGNFKDSRFRFQSLMEEFSASSHIGNALYWIGESFILEGRYDEAIAFFREALSRKSYNNYIDYCLYSLGYIFEKKGDYLQAAEQYERVISFHRESPLYPHAQIRIGLCYFRLGEYENTIVELSNPAITQLPQERQAEALYLLAYSHYQAAEYEDAANTYLTLITKYPASPYIREARYALAWSSFQLKKYQEAFRVFNSLLEGSDSIAINAAYWRAEAKRYQGANEEALKFYDEFIKKYPRASVIPRVRYQAGIVLYNLARYDEAAVYLTAAAQAPDALLRAHIFTLLGEVELNRKNFAGAKTNFEVVTRQQGVPGEFINRVNLGLAMCAFYGNDHKTALTLLVPLAAAYPEFEPDKVNFYLAEAHFAAGNYADAFKAYNRVSTDVPALGEAVLLGKGYAAYNQKDFENAAFIFSDFVKRFPASARAMEVRVRVADCYFTGKNYAAATQAYEVLLRQAGAFKNKDYVHYQYALALFRDKKSSRAIEELRKLIAAYSRSPYAENAVFLIGWIYFQQNNFSDAISSYLYLLDFSPKSRLLPNVYYSVGDAYFNSGNYDSAITYYQKLLTQFPASASVFDAVNGIQYCYQAQGVPESAVSVIDDFISTYPNLAFSDQIYLKKGEIYYSQRNYEAAKTAYADFIARFAKSKLLPDAWYWVGKCEANLGNTAAALENYRVVFNRYPTATIASAAVVEIGAIHTQAGRFDEAAALFTKAMEVFKDPARNAELLFLKGSAYLAKGDNANAYDAFDEVVLYYDGNVFADKSRVELGLLELNNNKFDAALKHFRAVTAKRTDDIAARAQYLIGGTLFRQGKTADAVTEFVRVINIYPAYEDWVAGSYLSLGDCYVALGDVKKAKEMYKLVIAKHKTDDYGKEAQLRLKKLK